MKMTEAWAILRKLGWTCRNGKGRHQVWTGPGGARMVLLSDPHKEANVATKRKLEKLDA